MGLLNNIQGQCQNIIVIDAFESIVNIAFGKFCELHYYHNSSLLQMTLYYDS